MGQAQFFTYKPAIDHLDKSACTYHPHGFAIHIDLINFRFSINLPNI